MHLLLEFGVWLAYAEDQITIQNENYWRENNTIILGNKEVITQTIKRNNLRFEYYPIEKYYSENSIQEIELWIKSYIDVDKEWYNGNNFLNPIDFAMRKDDKKLFLDMLEICKNYINTPNHTGMGGVSSIIWEAVGLDNEYYAVKLFSNGLELQNQELYIDDKDHFSSNILTFDRSINMQNILVQYGAEEFANEEWDSYCLDDNVRIRKSNSIKAEISTMLSKGTKFHVLGYTYMKYVLPDSSIGRWVKIEYNGKIGRIWSKYVYKYYYEQ